MRDLADAIQHMHKDCKNKHAVDTAIILFAQCPLFVCYLFFVFERSVLMALVFCNKGMLEKVTVVFFDLKRLRFKKRPFLYMTSKE